METKKKILLITTGGTIASIKTDGGLLPDIDADTLLSYIKDSEELADVTTAELLNLDSTNVGPKHWKVLTEYIKSQYDLYDGFVITHGTDTMAYTAAALSYMIQNSSKPIVLTGSQKPINLDITDAKTNLRDSIVYACDKHSKGIQIVFAGQVIAGTRAKKIRSKSYNAFSSIDFPTLAIIQDDKIFRYIYMIDNDCPTEFFTELNPNVFLLKMTPGISAGLLRYIFEKYDGIIIESFGVGGIPLSIRDEFSKLCTENPDKMIIMATQVSHEGSDMTIYEVGNSMKTKCNFLESYDMTLEAVLAKTMWILGNFEGKLKEEKFYTKINYDLVWEK